MAIQCFFRKYQLNFTFKAGTSRGVLENKHTYFIILSDSDGKTGIGEAGPLKGLSLDDRGDFEDRLADVCQMLSTAPLPQQASQVADFINTHIAPDLPAIRFGTEVALLDYSHGGNRLIVPNSWSEKGQPIAINGLVWMGDKKFMLDQINSKPKQGFTCIKMKIGAIDFKTELALLATIRQQFSSKEITLRVDANGAFHPLQALEKLRQLAQYDIHSIEQPIRPGQIESMAALCKQSPVPIALDEELIGVRDIKDKGKLLDAIDPAFIILKPTLLGGLAASKNWIQLAKERNIGWWITSALESNIGLNAIAQFASAQQVTMPQGLGTGQLYYNNIPSPLEVNQGLLNYNPEKNWDLSAIL